MEMVFEVFRWISAVTITAWGVFVAVILYQIWDTLKQIRMKP